jgi:hypothetical protein
MVRSIVIDLNDKSSRPYKEQRIQQLRESDQDAKMRCAALPLRRGKGMPTTHADRINADILEFLTDNQSVADVAHYEGALAGTSSS